MPEIAAYADPFEAAPGERVRVMVSTDRPTFTTRLVRVLAGDEAPEGPGARRVAVPGPWEGERPGRVQEVRRGSFAVADPPPSAAADASCTLDVWIAPTRPRADGPQCAVGWLAPGDERGWAVGLDADGHLALHVARGDGSLAAVRAPAPAHPRRWIHVVVVVDVAAGRATLAWDVAAWPRTRGRVALDLTGLAPATAGLPFALAGASVVRDDRGRPSASRLFDGKVGAPRLSRAPLDGAGVDALLAGTGGAPLPDLVAAWDLAHDPAGDVLPDAVGGRDLVCVNLPTRAVTGPRWTAATDAAQAPGEYDAVHFHHDDIEDAGWEPDLEIVLPRDLPSGVYGVELEAGGARDLVPVFVSPPRGTATSDVAMLFPTVSYLAYANERMQDHPKLDSPGWLSRPVVSDEGDLALKEHPEYGSSIYDTHADGSGVCLSSARRPVLNLRPWHRNWQTHAPRALAADLYVTDLLDRDGVAVDTITDHRLDAEGVELLSRYRVLITGSHPEYWTEPMLDALHTWLDGGGRLMYLGGNGFYWVTSVHPRKPWVVEVRRGIGGIRTWESAPGELRHQSTLEPGGLWRYRGRDPNRYVGIGFAAQGWDPVAPGYARTEAAEDPRASWIFAGVDEEVVGDSGLILGGAAGDEIDRYDVRWGSPPHALVVATSAGRHTEYLQLVCEDLPVTHPNTGGDVHPGVRADMVFFETAGGGAVFSVGSMSWNGSLPVDGFDGSATRVTRNVLARFLDPAPFPDPPNGEPVAIVSQASAVGPIPGEQEPAPAPPT